MGIRFVYIRIQRDPPVIQNSQNNLGLGNSRRTTKSKESTGKWQVRILRGRRLHSFRFFTFCWKRGFSIYLAPQNTSHDCNIYILPLDVPIPYIWYFWCKEKSQTKWNRDIFSSASCICGIFSTKFQNLRKLVSPHWGNVSFVFEITESSCLAQDLSFLFFTVEDIQRCFSSNGASGAATFNAKNGAHQEKYFFLAQCSRTSSCNILHTFLARKTHRRSAFGSEKWRSNHRHRIKRKIDANQFKCKWLRLRHVKGSKSEKIFYRRIFKFQSFGLKRWNFFCWGDTWSFPVGFSSQSKKSGFESFFSSFGNEKRSSVKPWLVAGRRPQPYTALLLCFSLLGEAKTLNCCVPVNQKKQYQVTKKKYFIFAGRLALQRQECDFSRTWNYLGIRLIHIRIN